MGITNAVETSIIAIGQSPLLSEECIEQIRWEIDRQARRNAFERKNDRHERPDAYRQPQYGQGKVACALPMRPVPAKKGNKR